ncbi:MAG TPA: DUF4785 domain-containing protein, partial [Dokdonella sp.]|nr:DUF4785 domain-containing protein [Dokdonella sp.]
MPQAQHRSLFLAVALTIVSVAATAPVAAGESLRLLAQRPDDLVAAHLRTPAHARLETATLETAPVALSWPLEPSQTLAARPHAYAAESREYWIDASASELQRGVRLALSAPGAVVRLSPHGADAGAALATADVQLRVDGRRLDNATAIRDAADADALRAAGMEVPQGSTVLKLADTVAGDVELAVPTARGNYLVHVFEPNSTLVLTLAAERDGIAGGESLRVRASVQGAAALTRIGGLVSAPDGASQSIDFVRQRDGSYVADVTPDVAHAGGRGLWEVHAFGVASGTLATPRDAKSAFAVSLPVARFDGNAVRGDGTGVVLGVGIEASVASRYSVSGVLYGTGPDGALHPAAIAQSAAWLAAGRGRLELRYDRIPDALRAPWEVRDLRLVNQ